MVAGSNPAGVTISVGCLALSGGAGVNVSHRVFQGLRRFKHPYFTAADLNPAYDAAHIILA
jgi:hypothetical protein